MAGLQQSYMKSPTDNWIGIIDNSFKTSTSINDARLLNLVKDVRGYHAYGEKKSLLIKVSVVRIMYKGGEVLIVASKYM